MLNTLDLVRLHGGFTGSGVEHLSDPYLFARCRMDGKEHP